MYNNKHSGKNIKTTDFTKEVIKRAAASLDISEIKLVAEVMEQEFSRIAKRVRGEK